MRIQQGVALLVSGCTIEGEFRIGMGRKLCLVDGAAVPAAGLIVVGLGFAGTGILRLAGKANDEVDSFRLGGL